MLAGLGEASAILQVIPEGDGMRQAEGRLTKALEYTAPSVQTLVFLDNAHLYKVKVRRGRALCCMQYEMPGVARSVASLKSSDSVN